MYADRHAKPEGIKPGSLAVAVGINVGLVAALLLSNPAFVKLAPDHPLETINIPIVPPPPPEPQPTPEARTKTEQPRPTPPEQPDLSALKGDSTTLTYPPLPPLPPQPEPTPWQPSGGATSAPILPVLVGAVTDPRFARDLQPAYPPAERRLEREGKVRLRVLIGVDGRVRQVERVDATSDAFFQATERQALAKWRFKPATRDGIPYESWKAMTVTFRLEEE